MKIPIPILPKIESGKPLQDGYYCFDCSTGSYITYSPSLDSFEKGLYDLIDSKLVQAEPYSKIMNEIQEKIGHIYIIHLNEAGIDKTINLSKMINDVFKNCYTKYLLTLEMVFNPNDIRMYGFHPDVIREIKDVKINDDRIFCLMPQYTDQVMVEDWLEQNLENYEICRIAGSFILRSDVDLNLFRISMEDGHQPLILRYKDIARKLIDYGFAESNFI